MSLATTCGSRLASAAVCTTIHGVVSFVSCCSHSARVRRPKISSSTATHSAACERRAAPVAKRGSSSRSRRSTTRRSSRNALRSGSHRGRPADRRGSCRPRRAGSAPRRDGIAGWCRCRRGGCPRRRVRGPTCPTRATRRRPPHRTGTLTPEQRGGDAPGEERAGGEVPERGPEERDELVETWLAAWPTPVRAQKSVTS